MVSDSNVELSHLRNSSSASFSTSLQSKSRCRHERVTTVSDHTQQNQNAIIRCLPAVRLVESLTVRLPIRQYDALGPERSHSPSTKHVKRAAVLRALQPDARRHMRCIHGHNVAEEPRKTAPRVRHEEHYPATFTYRRQRVDAITRSPTVETSWHTLEAVLRGSSATLCPKLRSN